MVKCGKIEEGDVSMNSMEMVSILIMPIILLYIFIFIMMFGQKYIRTYTRNKILKFTQEEVKEKRKEIADIFDKMQFVNDDYKFWQKEHYNSIIKIFSLYNELAVGINEGLYDELYIKMVMGYDMTLFYKYNYKMVVSTADMDISSTRFMPLELLLKKWDSGDAPSYRFNKHRRYL